MSSEQLSLIEIAGSLLTYYDQCYMSCHPDSSGFISSVKAVDFLKSSGLSDRILSGIWECSDTHRKGFLTKYEFQVALKLVALAQNQLEPRLQNLSLSTPGPRLNMSSHNTNSTMSPINVWSISLDEQNRYSKIFDSLDSLNGKLSGEAIKPVFINSKLPLTTLGQVWTLSDIDKDGSLDRDEFILAMHLIYKCLAGENLPLNICASMIPPSKRRAPSVNIIISNISSGIIQSSFHVPQSDWVVGKLEKERYDTQFFAADKDRDGLLSGLEIKDIFAHSGLSQNVLANIWDLCDVNKSGMLNSEQFALAMHLINDQISSAGTKPIPSSLTMDMMPPSLRAKSGDPSFSDSLTLSSFGLKTESDDVYKEIEIIRRERAQVEQICRQYEADYKCQMQEVQDQHDILNRTTQTAQALSKQKEEAQHRLDELTEQRNCTQIILEETKYKCKEEREQLDTLKRQMGNQTVSIEEKRSDLKRLQTELNDLIREESSLREQIQQHQSRLSLIDQETSSTETHIVVAEDKNKELESLRSSLQEVLHQYDYVVANPDMMDVSKLPDSAMVDQLLASTIIDQDTMGTNTWVSEDPFMKNDPFSTIADPFSGTSDPFSSQDPFSSSDPFSSNNGWINNTTNLSTNDKTSAFSLGNIDDLFQDMSTNESSFQNHFESNLDMFGFGDSPFDITPGKIVPPPRPAKAPQASITKLQPSNNRKTTKTKLDLDTSQSVVSETDQLSWAKQESEREARNAEMNRKREKADFEMALKLSQVEYKTQERKKTSKNKK